MCHASSNHARTFRYEAVGNGGLSLFKRISNHFHRILWHGSCITTDLDIARIVRHELYGIGISLLGRDPLTLRVKLEVKIDDKRRYSCKQYFIVKHCSQKINAHR
jgi:hypothetical protein